jgi:hypothetical protein
MGGVARVVRRQAPRDIPLGFHFEVRAHLLGHVAVKLRAPEELAQTKEASMEEIHRFTGERRGSRLGLWSSE